MTNSVNYVEHEKSIQVHGAKLSGTLCLHQSMAPRKVVLMIPGSGEIDRNENAMKLQLNTLNSLAHSFAEAGIASLRFDKRGVADSEGQYHETGFYDFVDDAGAWLDALNTFTEIDNADKYLLGHSEGTLIAAFLSARKPAVKGQILLTPFLENMELLIERQLKQTLDEVSVLTGLKGFIVRLFLRLSGNQLKRQRKIMRQIKNSKKSSIKFKKTLINAKWLRELCGIEPADVFRKVNVPTLAIGGEKDLQCVPTDAQEVAKLVNGPAEFHILSDMTHILRVDEQVPSTFKYKNLSENPVDNRVPEIILKWLQSAQR